MTVAEHHPLIHTSIYRDPQEAPRVAMGPFNRYVVAVFVTGEPTPVRSETMLAPTHIDAAMQRATALARTVEATGATLRGVQVFGTYTADGCFMWSGGPLASDGRVTVGLVEWGECRAANDAVI